MALKDLVRRGAAPKPQKPRRSIEPMPIDSTSWMYPLKKGLAVVHEFRDRGKYLRTDTIIIKWVDVATALEHGRLAKNYHDMTDDKD